MKLLTKDQIRSIPDRTFEIVHIAEWGGNVRVATMSAGDRDRWEQAIFGRRTGDIAANELQLRVMTAICCVQDEDGKPLFTEADAEWLTEKAAGPLSDIFDVAVRLSRLSKRDQEELTKN